MMSARDFSGYVPAGHGITGDEAECVSGHARCTPSRHGMTSRLHMLFEPPLDAVSKVFFFSNDLSAARAVRAAPGRTGVRLAQVGPGREDGPSKGFFRLDTIHYTYEACIIVHCAPVSNPEMRF